MKGLTKAMVIVLLAMAFLSIFPQKIPSIHGIGSYYCYYRYRLQNEDRYCYGNINCECSHGIHDPPWGNWGVDSNLGCIWDGNQFMGWKKKWSWATWAWQWQWNSCTFGEWYPPKECGTYYNADERSPGLCWEQITSEGTDVYAWTEVYFEIPEIYWDYG